MLNIKMASEQEMRGLLDDLRKLKKENEWVEFKLNFVKPEDIGEYISALANSACLHKRDAGYLVYGIDDKTHKVKGTIFKPKEKKVKEEELESWIFHNLEPSIDFEIFEFQYKKLPVVIFKIDATRLQPIRFKGVSYIRVGSYKKRLENFADKERKIWEMTNDSSFEKVPALKEQDADEILRLLDYPSYFRLMEMSLPTNKAKIIAKLCEEELIIKKGKQYDITNLGALLFCNDLKKFSGLFRKAIRIIIYDGRNRLKTKREYNCTKGYALAFEEIINYVNDQLQVNEEIGKAFRKEVKVYPDLAIRELVANAIIHQDLHMRGTSPTIEMFSDRIEITNPGKPLINILRFIDHSPQSRNERLASFMRRIKICEERGSGIDKVVDSIEMYQLPAPDFIDDEHNTKAILYAPKTLRQMDRKDKIRACYQHCVLKYVSNGRMTNQSLRERFKISEKNYPIASRIIHETIKTHLIKEEKKSIYIPFWA